MFTKKGIIFLLSLAITLVGVFVAGNSTHSSQAQAATQTFTNPLMTGADPHMFYKDGYYYFVKTEGNKITVWKTESPVDLKYAKPVIVWRAPSGTAYCCNVWAPEIHYIDGRWYIYFAADNGDDHYHRMYVLESQTQDAQGAYTFKGKIAPPNAPNAWAIDGTVFRHTDGKLYFVWSGRPGTDLTAWQQIYIAQMSNPYTISGNRVSIVQATYSWEKKGWDGTTFGIVEAPAVLQRNGKTFITYSASFFATPDYALGMITNSNGKVLSPSSWSKRSSPVFKQTYGVYGPGHNAFTKSPDGTEDWIIYHARNTTSSSEKRTIRAQKFSWGSTGAPIFGTPIKAGVEIPLPSGDSYGDLVVEKFALADSDGVERTVFPPGRQIYPRVTVRNLGYRPVRVVSGTMTSPVMSDAPDPILKNTSSDVNVYLKVAEIPGFSTVSFDASPVSTDRSVFPNGKSWSKDVEGTYTARIYLNNGQTGKEATYGNNQATVVYTISSESAEVTPTPTPTIIPTPTPTPTVVLTPTPTPTITPTPTPTPTPTIVITPTPTPTPTVQQTVVQSSYPSLSNLAYFTTYDSKRTLFRVKNDMTLKKVECYRCGSNTRFVVYESDSTGTFGREIANQTAAGVSSSWYYATVNLTLRANAYYILRFDNTAAPVFYGTTQASYSDLDFLKYSTYVKSPSWKNGAFYIRLTYVK